MKPQYELIKRLRPLSEATNYALFYLLVLIQILLAAAYFIVRLKKAPVSICSPGKPEFLVSSLGLVVSCYVLFFDPAHANASRPFDS